MSNSETLEGSEVLILTIPDLKYMLHVQSTLK
jgi:hypothetical protein